MKLSVRGIPVDISQVEDSRVRTVSGTWVKQPDVMHAVTTAVEGIDLPVQDKAELLAYKKLLVGDSHRADIEQIS